MLRLTGLVFGVSDGLFRKSSVEYDDQEDKELYNKVCKQRELERKVRASKRECMMLKDGDLEMFQKASVKLKHNTQQLKTYCSNNDLMYMNERTSVMGYGRSEAGKVTAAYNRALKQEQEKLNKALDKTGGSGIINAGAFSGAKKTSGWQERHGERMYEEIRHRSTDVKRISECTPFKEAAVEEIKQHMFFKEHRFSDGTIRRFDSDFDQAQAWDRLTKGEGTATDIEMLKHEYVELTQMRIHGYDYETAHDIANSKHNWARMLIKEMKK